MNMLAGAFSFAAPWWWLRWRIYIWMCVRMRKMRPGKALLALNLQDPVVGCTTHFLAALPSGQLARGLIGVAVAIDLAE